MNNITKLKKIENVKTYHGDIVHKDEYAYVDQPHNILEVLKDPTKVIPEVRKYIDENYGKDFPYRGFAQLFNPKKYDPSEWANLFKMSGAKYVVLTSKHHDGFCLWPSEHSNGYNSFDTPAKRDLLGDLT